MGVQLGVGREERDAVRGREDTVGAMRLPEQRASFPVMTPSWSKSNNRAPTFEKLLSPVGCPLMMNEGRSGGAVGDGASRHVTVPTTSTRSASASSARFGRDPFMASSFARELPPSRLTVKV